MSKVTIREEKTLTVKNNPTSARYGNAITFEAKIEKGILTQFTIWNEISHVTFGGSVIEEFRELLEEFIVQMKTRNEQS